VVWHRQITKNWMYCTTSTRIKVNTWTKKEKKEICQLYSSWCEFVKLRLPSGFPLQDLKSWHFRATSLLDRSQETMKKFRKLFALGSKLNFLSLIRWFLINDNHPIFYLLYFFPFYVYYSILAWHDVYFPALTLFMHVEYLLEYCSMCHFTWKSS